MAKTNQSTKASKAKKTLNDEIIFDINDSDILCGKEKHCVSHPGSLNFRAAIDKYASKYQEAVTKQEKMNVTKEIYDSLGSQNSRFLKFNADAKGWEELSSLLARDKISHALRFANREKKAPSTSKPRSKKGHRRTGSDSSTSTLATAATELSVEDFDYLLDDNEPLDWSAEGTADVERKPYVYPVYESAPPTPPPAAYHSYGHPQPYYPHPHAYGHSYYHPQSYHHSFHHPQQHYAPAPAAPQPMPQHHQCETMESMDFPEKPQQEAPVRESSMDVDLSYIMTEPLMDFDLE